MKIATTIPTRAATRQTGTAARLDWRIGRAVFLGVEGRWEDRSGDTGYSYDETVYLASISYRPGEP